MSVFPMTPADRVVHKAYQVAVLDQIERRIVALVGMDDTGLALKNPDAHFRLSATRSRAFNRVTTAMLARLGLETDLVRLAEHSTDELLGLHGAVKAGQIPHAHQLANEARLLLASRSVASAPVAVRNCLADWPQWSSFEVALDKSREIIAVSPVPALLRTPKRELHGPYVGL